MPHLQRIPTNIVERTAAKTFHLLRIVVAAMVELLLLYVRDDLSCCSV